MLIIQHIWTKWTKLSRGADRALKRPRLAEAYPFPPHRDPVPVLRHEVRALESEGFEIRELVGAIDRETWPRQLPWRNTALDWRLRPEGADILLHKPSEHTQQTKWPAHLPSPLLRLGEGESARIEWNGRFRASMMGSNRGSYFEQHVYWLAVAAEPHPRIFLEAEPKKRIDLTTHIY
jgi:hypothetical protein